MAVTENEKVLKNRQAVKKCMESRDRINIILPQGTVDRINAYGLKTSAFETVNIRRTGKNGQK